MRVSENLSETDVEMRFVVPVLDERGFLQGFVLGLSVRESGRRGQR